MADLEKVLNGLESCLHNHDCKNCRYKDEYDHSLDCIDRNRTDAIELLKSQQAKMDAMFRMLKSRGERIKELTARNEKLYNDWLSLAEK